MAQMGDKQNTLVINHLKHHKTITPIKAFIHYQIFRLAARIYELRSQGWKIETVMKSGLNGRKYAQYRLK